MKRQILFERWWGRAVGGFTLLFLIWFILSQMKGLRALAQFLIDAVAAVPDSLRLITEYYRAMPFQPLASSLAIGVVCGTILTVLVFFANRNWIRLPAVPGPALFVGAVLGIALYYMGVSLVYGTAAALAAALAITLVIEPDSRELFSRRTARLLLYPEPRRILFQGSLLGAVGGGLGSQLLTYPMQHCTYAAEALPVEKQVGIIITLVGVLLVLIPVWTLNARRGRRAAEATSGYFGGWALPYGFLLPTLLSLIVFLYYPAMQIATLSLKAQRFRQERFVCLGNYVDLANDVIYRNSFTTTFSFTIAIVMLSMALALGIALLASQKVRGAGIYRTLLIWPYALSPVVVGTIFLAMFRQGRVGLINYALYSTFDVTPNWFTNPSLAPWVVILASVWNALGFNILFYIAGLQNIPQDLLDAGQIDGANVFQRFFRITFPLLSPFTFFLLVTNVTYSFYGIYGAIDTLTQGGPPLGVGGAEGGATNALIFKLYEDAFATGAQVGKAAAQSVILFLFVAIITLLQFRYVERQVIYAD